MHLENILVDKRFFDFINGLNEKKHEVKNRSFTVYFYRNATVKIRVINWTLYIWKLLLLMFYSSYLKID